MLESMILGVVLALGVLWSTGNQQRACWLFTFLGLGSGDVGLLCFGPDTLSSYSAREYIQKAKEGRKQNKGLRL